MEVEGPDWRRRKKKQKQQKNKKQWDRAGGGRCRGGERRLMGTSAVRGGAEVVVESGVASERRFVWPLGRCSRRSGVFSASRMAGGKVAVSALPVGEHQVLEQTGRAA